MSQENNVSQFRKGFRQAPAPTKGQVLKENQTLTQQHEAQLAQLLQIANNQGQMVGNLMRGFQDTKQNIEQLQIWDAAEATSEAAKAGDHVLMDYAGVLLKEDGSMEELAPGVPALFDGGNGELFILTQLGSGKMIPGFEEAIIGRKVGEELEAIVQFPEQYVNHLKGRKAKFYITIRQVRAQYPASVVGELIRQHGRLKSELAAKAAAEATANSDKGPGADSVENPTAATEVSQS